MVSVGVVCMSGCADHVHVHVQGYGHTLVSDGATTNTGVPFLNILLISAGCVMFEKAVDTSGHTKDKEFIAKFVVDAIMARANPQSCVQVLMGACGVQPWKSGMECGACIGH